MYALGTGTQVHGIVFVQPFRFQRVFVIFTIPLPAIEAKHILFIVFFSLLSLVTVIFLEFTLRLYECMCVCVYGMMHFEVDAVKWRT